MRQPISSKITDTFKSATNAASASLLVGCTAVESVRDVLKPVTESYTEILEKLVQAEPGVDTAGAHSDNQGHGQRAFGSRRGKRSAANLRANAAWSRKHSDTFDPESFAKEIGPRLATASRAAMMRATGLSRPYYSMIRRGVRIPHPRHWEALRGLVS
jgi:hypothetical protein